MVQLHCVRQPANRSCPAVRSEMEQKFHVIIYQSGDEMNSFIPTTPLPAYFCSIDTKTFRGVLDANALGEFVFPRLAEYKVGSNAVHCSLDTAPRCRVNLRSEIL